VILEDVDHADVLNPLLREKGIKSMLGVPLLFGGEAIGVLHVGVLTPRIFTGGDVELLQLVADRVAVALERTRLHDETLMLDQLRVSFVAIASHELRTPAAAVYGVLMTLAGKRELTDEVREQLLQVGVQQGERLRRLLEELLELSRLDSRAISVEPKPLVVRAALDEIAREALPHGTPLTLDVPDDLAAVADRRVLDRVLSNLLSNAASHGRPPYVVAAEQRDRHLRIAVCDEGPGVPDSVQPRLFERFSRGEDGSGTGLGLAISRAYARAHGGDVIYDPRGHGARFELILPQN
jgi:two-component system sensor histidine kinase MtrB